MDRLIELNVNFSVSLWDWCAAAQVPFLYASSAATYGDRESDFSDRDDVASLSQLRPLNGYGWSKKAADQIRQINSSSFQILAAGESQKSLGEGRAASGCMNRPTCAFPFTSSLTANRCTWDNCSSRWSTRLATGQNQSACS